jgi:hypothetical protein
MSRGCATGDAHVVEWKKILPLRRFIQKNMRQIAEINSSQDRKYVVPLRGKN